MAFGADRTVKVNVKATVSDYIGKITAASKATKDFAQTAERTAKSHKESWSKVSTGMLAAGTVLAAGVGLAIKSYADFDQKLSTVRAVSGATAEQMKELGAAALKAGADTKFSASQAAEAEGELAKLGVSTADILGGALRGSLDLAAAGNLNLADAATYAGQAMKIFNLNGKDVPRIADTLAAGANKSAADVQTLAQAMQQGGLVAAQTGLTLEDTVGVLSAFSDNALNGSDAGTSLKTMLQRLNPQSKQAADLMDQLGLRAYDAQGSFVGVTAYAGRLQKALGGMTAEQRNATLQIIFGADAVRAANVLYKEGAAGIASYVAGVKDQGAAARVAAIQMDNLKGDLEQLRGSIETALIQAGSAGNDTLRGLVQTVTDAVNLFGKLPGPVQKTALVVGGVAAASLLAVGGMMKLISGVASAKVAMTELGIASRVSKDQLVGVGKGAAKASAALAALMIAGQALGGNNTGVNKATESLNAYLEGGKDAAGVTAEMAYGFNNLGSSLGWAAKGGTIEGIARQLGDLTGLGNGPQKFFRELDTALAEFVRTGRQGEAQKIFDQLAASAGRQGISLARVMDALPQYGAALQSAGQGAASAAAPTEELAGIVDGVAVSAQDAGEAVDKYVKALADAGLVQLSARDAARGFQQALDDAAAAVKENGRTLDITTQKGRDNQAALDGVASAAISQAQALYESVKATKGEAAGQDAYRASLVKSRTSLQAMAEKFGLSRAEARRFADQILQIPTARTTKVTLTGAETATQKARALRDALLGIKNRTVTVDVITGTANKLIANPKLLEKADGGRVTGPGTGTSDSIPAYLSNGEYVVKAAAVNKYGPAFFDRLNSMRFASGGLVTAATRNSAPNSGAQTTVTLNAFGNDSVQATQKALREWQFQQVPR